MPEHLYGKIDFDSHRTTYIDINSRRIIGLNVKTKTIKFLEEETEKHLHDLGVGRIFPFLIDFYFHLLREKLQE